VFCGWLFYNGRYIAGFLLFIWCSVPVTPAVHSFWGPSVALDFVAEPGRGAEVMFLLILGQLQKKSQQMARPRI
jgi:hypothetical protein